LTEAAQVFLGELSLLKPDMGVFTQMDGVTYDNGNLMIPELDMIINTDSMYGILTLELQAAELSGADMKAFTDDMNAVTDNYLAQLANNETFTAAAASGSLFEINKGVYKTSTPIYGGGRVYYSWGDFGLNNIESAHKAALQEAMAEWENAVDDVGGDIDFINKTNDVFHQAFAVNRIDKTACNDLGQSARKYYGTGDLGRIAGQGASDAGFRLTEYCGFSIRSLPYRPS
jgi:hypothetical protein